MGNGCAGRCSCWAYGCDELYMLVYFQLRPVQRRPRRSRGRGWRLLRDGGTARDESELRVGGFVRALGGSTASSGQSQQASKCTSACVRGPRRRPTSARSPLHHDTSLTSLRMDCHRRGLRSLTLLRRRQSPLLGRSLRTLRNLVPRRADPLLQPRRRCKAWLSYSSDSRLTDARTRAARFAVG